MDALSGAIKDSCGVQRKLRLPIGNASKFPFCRTTATDVCNH